MRALLIVTCLAASTACQCAGTVNTQLKCSPNLACPKDFDCVAGLCVARQPDAGTPDAGGSGDAGNAPDAGALTQLTVDPPSATLTSGNGARPTLTFTARATFEDGSSRPVDATFTATQQVIGTVDPVSGVYTASGSVGGTSDVTAAWAYRGVSLTAVAALTVKLSWITTDPALPGNAPALFTTPLVDAARAADVAYPLDGVVFPQNVAPADVQWLSGAANDFYRLTFAKTDVRFVAYALDPGDHHHLPDGAAWRALAQTNPTETATLTVDRLDVSTNQTIAGTPLRMKFARAALTGSVYYWDIAAGRIVRIDDGTTTRTQIMPNPPVAVGGDRCVGCHAVSASGRYMAGRLGGGENIGGVFDLTTNLTADPAPTVWPTSVSPPSASWWFSSFNPDETRLVVSLLEGGASGAMGFLNPLTGAPVTVANLPAGKVTHVAWSPDGKTIAYVDAFGTWGGDFTAGDISVVPVTAADTLGTASKLHLGANLAASFPAGVADSYPTWSPDSLKVAFSHGTGCRSENQQAALYLVNKDGSNVVRLTNASGGPTGANCFQPRFSPFTADGYQWMTFLSRRDYGNAQVGTRGADRQQIWVAAIKTSAAVGDDASEVPYWLPGQATTSRNIAAYWAARPCRKQGDACTVGSECCSTVCAPGGTGALVCSPPPPAACRKEGESCGATADCCAGKGLICKNNSCATDIQ